MVRSVISLGVLSVCATAYGHGSVPSPATFISPPALSATASTGERLFAPYAFPVVDASYDIAFTDGDTDPFAHHFFYYLDHAPPLALTVDQIPMVGTPIADVPGGLWAACSCPADFGLTCPDAGTRDCRNGFSWNTSAVPAGVYWIVAATQDTPFDVYTVGDGPVTIAHGTPAPPAAILVAPDGFGTFDGTYHVRWLAHGTPPFHVDLAYAEDADVKAAGAWTPIATDVPLVNDSDGSFAYDWDISALENARIFYVRATIKDATGLSSFTESRAGVTVYHPGTSGDLSIPTLEKHASGCDVAPHRTWLGTLGWLAFVAPFLALGVVLVRRRA